MFSIESILKVLFVLFVVFSVRLTDASRIEQSNENFTNKNVGFKDVEETISQKKIEPISAFIRTRNEGRQNLCPPGMVMVKQKCRKLSRPNRNSEGSINKVSQYIICNCAASLNF